MIFGFVRKENIFLLQHYHPIRHIHCQIAVSEFLADFDSWDMFTIIGSRSPHGQIADAYYFLELSPLVKLRPFEKTEMKFCKCHISKSIKARILKLASAERG